MKYIIGLVVGLFLLGGCMAVVMSNSSESSKPNTPSVADPVTPKSKTPPQKTESAAPKKDPVTEFPDGDYVVGVDIPSGTYETEGATPGLFELCTISTEGDDGDNWGQLKSANAHERIIITLDKSDGVLSINGCEPLVKR